MCFGMPGMGGVQSGNPIVDRTGVDGTNLGVQFSLAPQKAPQSPLAACLAFGADVEVDYGPTPLGLALALGGTGEQAIPSAAPLAMALRYGPSVGKEFSSPSYCTIVDSLKKVGTMATEAAKLTALSSAWNLLGAVQESGQAAASVVQKYSTNAEESAYYSSVDGVYRTFYYFDIPAGTTDCYVRCTSFLSRYPDLNEQWTYFNSWNAYVNIGTDVPITALVDGALDWTYGQAGATLTSPAGWIGNEGGAPDTAWSELVNFTANARNYLQLRSAEASLGAECVDNSTWTTSAHGGTKNMWELQIMYSPA